MKELFLIIFLLSTTFAFAEPPINEKYSFKDLSDMVMTDYDPKEFNNSTIVGSCFYQQDVVNRHIFPENMTGVVFRRCNLDNVYIPPNNIVIREGWETCAIRKLKLQNDLSQWVLDDTLKPVEPIDKEERLSLGISIDPKDIPTTKMTEYIVDKRRRELEAQTIP